MANVKINIYGLPPPPHISEGVTFGRDLDESFIIPEKTQSNLDESLFPGVQNIAYNRVSWRAFSSLCPLALGNTCLTVCTYKTDLSKVILFFNTRDHRV